MSINWYPGHMARTRRVMQDDLKNVDMICANNLKQSGAGFGVDTNVITIITRSEITELPLQSKESAANAILDAAVRLAP